jgi:hypothetical protein
VLVSGLRPGGASVGSSRFYAGFCSIARGIGQ